MEISDLVSAAVEHLVSRGVEGLIIAGLLSTIIILWRALQQERERGKELVDLMFSQSQETAAMIERITGR